MKYIKTQIHWEEITISDKQEFKHLFEKIDNKPKWIIL